MWGQREQKIKDDITSFLLRAKSECSHFHDVTGMKKEFFKLANVTFLISLSIMAATLPPQSVSGLPVAGAVTSDTLWRLEDSPIDVSGDLTVESGVTLSIEPGVEVRFGLGSSLIVNGSLYAVGTDANRIKFTSKNIKPATGDWTGIRFSGDVDSNFTIGFCDVDHAIDGIKVSSLGRAVVKHSKIIENSLSGIHAVGAVNLLIQNNTIKLNSLGISASGASASGLTITGNLVLDNQEGIHLDACGTKSRVSSVTIRNNIFRGNTHAIYIHSKGRFTTVPTKANAYINAVEILSNLMDSNEYAVYLLAEAWGEPGVVGGAYIYNSILSGNLISFSKCALYVNSSSNWYSYISNLNISRNTIHSCEDGILIHAFRWPQPKFMEIPFDITLTSNVISANDKGVEILGDVYTNFTDNAVAYNSDGICLNSSVPSENGYMHAAHSNHIYENIEYGVRVVEGASINATSNYWGAPSGPHHESLDPSGAGDYVSGNEEKLILTPFLAEPVIEINYPPFAILDADKLAAAVNETIHFDGMWSTDDSDIIRYFFDFGDGDTRMVYPGITIHEYAAPGVYNASLYVIDDLGVKSTNTATKTITVALTPLVLSIFLNPISVLAQENVTVEIHVSDGETGIPEAFVQLSSDHGGDFSASSGYTDSDGNLQSTFTAPNISEPVNIRISATGFKETYTEDSDEVYLAVLPRSSDGGAIESSWIWFVAIILVVGVAAFLLLRRRRKPTLSSSGRRGKRVKGR